MTVAMHRQVWVKVNAPVDEGVADLVLALSEIDGLETIESCEGSTDGMNAFVLFRYGSWRECGALLFDRLSASLEPQLRADVAVVIEAFGTGDAAIGRISVTPAALSPLCAKVHEVAMTYRMSGCSRGT